METKDIPDLFACVPDGCDTMSNRTSRDFRPIHYLGSKLRMLNAIEEVIDKLAPEGAPVCDIFAGSGSVSRRLSYRRPVTAVDIQEYSRVICSALLKPSHIPFSDDLQERIVESEYSSLLSESIEPLVGYEQTSIEKALRGDAEPLCELLESASLIGFEGGEARSISGGLTNALRETLSNIHRLREHGHTLPLVTMYFGGAYFSFRQSSRIDSILHQVFLAPAEHRDTLLAVTLSTVSEVVNTVGKHFAQPIRPRTSDGQPKRDLVRSVQKDRLLDVSTVFNSWLTTYNTLRPSGFHHAVYRADFTEVFDYLDPDIKVIYADPPYTRDHYSRYYHVLETICLQDSPGISRTIVAGRSRLSRGLYRNERYQSPFCIRSQAPGAFEALFSRSARHGATLVLSYSPYSQRAKSHPRVMTVEGLIAIAEKYYSSVSLSNPGAYTHSKLNRKEKSLYASAAAETLLVCQNK